MKFTLTSITKFGFGSLIHPPDFNFISIASIALSRVVEMCFIFKRSSVREIHRIKMKSSMWAVTAAVMGFSSNKLKIKKLNSQARLGHSPAKKRVESRA